MTMPACRACDASAILRAMKPVQQPNLQQELAGRNKKYLLVLNRIPVKANLELSVPV